MIWWVGNEGFGLFFPRCLKSSLDEPQLASVLLLAVTWRLVLSSCHSAPGPCCSGYFRYPDTHTQTDWLNRIQWLSIGAPGPTTMTHVTNASKSDRLRLLASSLLLLPHTRLSLSPFLPFQNYSYIFQTIIQHTAEHPWTHPNLVSRCIGVLILISDWLYSSIGLELRRWRFDEKTGGGIPQPVFGPYWTHRTGCWQQSTVTSARFSNSGTIAW